MEIQHFFDEKTHTVSYVVWDKSEGDALVIDPVLDYDPAASKVSTESVEKISKFLADHQLRLHWILETHAHADHLSGAQLLKARFGAKTAIGKNITAVQQIFKRVFDLPPNFSTHGQQFDRLLSDGETLSAGTLRIEVIATPGHTPACVSYKIDDAVFTGDALFMPDYGTGRTDFPGGSAHELYHSVHEKLYSLPDQTRVFVGHDYLPNGRPFQCATTIAESKQKNPQLRAETTENEFVKFRSERDAQLPAPALIYPSVQINVNAGHLPEPRENGVRYLSIPIHTVPTDAE